MTRSTNTCISLRGGFPGDSEDFQGNPGQGGTKLPFDPSITWLILPYGSLQPGSNRSMDLLLAICAVSAYKLSTAVNMCMWRGGGGVGDSMG